MLLTKIFDQMNKYFFAQNSECADIKQKLSALLLSQLRKPGPQCHWWQIADYHVQIEHRILSEIYL
jgi:hypothetical protein